MLAKSRMDWFTLNAVLFFILSQHKKKISSGPACCVCGLPMRNLPQLKINYQDPRKLGLPIPDPQNKQASVHKGVLSFWVYVVHCFDIL